MQPLSHVHCPDSPKEISRSPFVYCIPCLVLSAVMFGKWTDHVKSWRHTELGDRIMYLTYEEMVEVNLTEAELSSEGSTIWLSEIFDCRV